MVRILQLRQPIYKDRCQINKTNTMKKNLLFILFIFVIFQSKAQTTLDTAVNFSVKDVVGNTIKLFDILDEGKIVMIDFFSTA